MSVIDGLDVDKIYSHFRKGGHHKYQEEKHCKLLIKIMMDKNQGCYSAFCVQAMINERTLYKWVNMYELFGTLFYFTKLVAKQLWYEEGREIRDKEYQLGTLNYQFEHWKMLGWTKFGISNKNSRIKLNVDANETPAQHYASILKQAAEGDFTASEFKQLMEAVNVGLNVHQVFELQKQIDELKSDFEIVTANTNVENPFTNKGIAQKD